MGTTLPIVPDSERSRILGEVVSKEKHNSLYRAMPFRELVECGVPRNASPRRQPGHLERTSEEELRILAWNAARCRDVHSFARRIKEAGAMVVLLTEMDWGMARSGQRHTSRDLADELSFNYLFAVEFLELGLGDEKEKEEFRGAKNEVGYHGAAILSPYPVLQSERIMLEESGGWFGQSRSERRIGGRIALVALIDVGVENNATVGHEPASPVLFASVHLESESDPAERAEEMELLFDRLDEKYSGVPVVIGGDLNTFSVPRRELDRKDTIIQRLREAPTRFLDPTPFEPLFQRAESRGYEWHTCNEPLVPTHHSRGEENESLSMKIDWYLSRGLTVDNPRVICTPKEDTAPLSDHDPISLAISVGENRGSPTTK